MVGRTVLLTLLPLTELLISTVLGVSQSGINGSDSAVMKCKRQLDFSVIVDESGSINQQQWEIMYPFLQKIVQSLDLDYSDIRLSLTTFSTGIRSIFTFLDRGSHNQTAALHQLDLMHKTKPKYGMTYTGQALTHVHRFVLPYGRKHAPKAVLLVTDGGSSDPDVTAQAAAMLRDDGVTVLVVGVGNINVSECRGIVGCDATGECPLFVHTEWQEMIGMVNKLMKDVCETVSQDAVCSITWSEWSECNAECNKDGTRIKSIISLDTITNPTVGSNGQSGRTCTEQLTDHPPMIESCIGACHGTGVHQYDLPAPEISGALANGGSEGGAGTRTDGEGGSTLNPAGGSEGGAGTRTDGEGGSSWNPAGGSEGGAGTRTDGEGGSSWNPAGGSEGGAGTRTDGEGGSNETGVYDPEANTTDDKFRKLYGSEAEELVPPAYEGTKGTRDDEVAPIHSNDGNAGSKIEEGKTEPEGRKYGDDGSHTKEGKTEPEGRKYGDDGSHTKEGKTEPEGRQYGDDGTHAKEGMTPESSPGKGVPHGTGLNDHSASETYIPPAGLDSGSTTGSSSESASPGVSGTSVDGSKLRNNGTETGASKEGMFPQATNIGMAGSETGEATSDEDDSGSGFGSGNGAKIAGGVIAGLLLLGAGGGYALYKNKKSTPSTGSTDYTGGDESSKPLTEAETYEVTEFDNNIWGEAT
ncbi:von willebrand factor a-like domain containing protein [Babesia gibsoni]|uniref:von willebrand factor a-like domain containing protein n=1 Tax=Babesia gibsoni TaxID=33632 RepID=A0AAD8LKV6_BABGI|nr:von willebrand factor a-like domain containing protein [Babesia gibsoni]